MNYVYAEEKPSLDELAHYGVKGMKWGVRRDQAALDRAAGRSENIPKKVDRQAKKDAQESARAKMYYGDGAGTRRKLIKETVESRSKKDPNYKKAFETHRESQNMERHVKKAKQERKSTDAKDSAKKTTKSLARLFTGEHGTNAAFVALTVSAIAFFRTDSGKAIFNNVISTIKTTVEHQRGISFSNDLLNDIVNRR